ncbi:GAF domain-containing protein [Cypionkella sinensis]|uniref:GAF domain-containing protein n=1 Tax=Cypionkella sinensis TaxID=1756043 RepID=A0ABV7IZJ2_9RHOB
MITRGTENHLTTIETALARGEAARSPVVASWSRSARLHGLDPTKPGQQDRMTAQELSLARERTAPLIRAAAPNLDRLFQAVGAVGCCVLLADLDGVPLERRGAAVDDAVFSDWGLWPGTRWSEAQQGTNGIGTCLVEERVVTIHRDQHFFARNTILSCMSAPIYGPQGKLAGVLDVSSARNDLTEGFMTLISQSVTETAQKIEAQAFRDAFPTARMVLVPGERGLLAVDSDDLVIGATRAARHQLGLSGDLARQPRPAADVLGHFEPETLEDGERAVLIRALARAGGNVSAAARDLGISRATFHRKLGPRFS